MKISVLAAAAALTALLLAGCGGDNSSVATATTSSSGAGASSATTSDSGSSATTSESSASSDDADTTAPSFDGDSNSEFCQAARDLEASDIGTSLTTGEGDLKGDLEKVEAAIGELKDKAPDEIKADIDTFANGVQQIKDFYAKYDYDQAKVLAAAQKDPAVMQQAIAAFSDADFTAASSRIAAYGSQVCGISDTTETT